MIETTFVLTDKMGPEGIKKVEDTFNELNSQYNERLKGDSGKRKAHESPMHVAMTQESYYGIANKNTHRML